MDPLKLARNLIKVGRVNNINDSKGSVDVLFDDRDDLVVDDLPLLNAEYNMPSVGEQVLCIFLGNGPEQGFCLGSFHSDVSKPPVSDRNIYRKDFGDGTFFQYDKTTKKMIVSSQGPVEVIGNLIVGGDINAEGRVSGSNIGN